MRHRRLIAHLVRRIAVNVPDYLHDDLIQEALMALVVARRTVETPNVALTIRWAIVGGIRKQYHNLRAWPDITFVPLNGTDREIEHDWGDFWIDVERNLPPADWELVRRHFLGEEDFVALGAERGVTGSAEGQRFMAIRRRLREALEDYREETR